MRARSMRFRITAVATIAVALVLVGVSVALVVSQQSQLTSNLDTSLRQRADDIAALVSADVPSELGAADSEAFSQLVSEGAVVAASSNIAGWPPLDVAMSGIGTEQVQSITGLAIHEDDDTFRVLSRMLTVAGSPSVLHVGASVESVGDSTEALSSSLAVVIPLVVAVFATLIWLLVGRTLQPVEAIRSQVDAIGGDDLSRRVAEPPTGDEIASLAGTMNLMLDRLEQGVADQQRFVADASHELRSPLTRMRSELEVDLRTASGGDQARMESIHDEVVGLQRLVEDLLHLARSDAGEQAINSALVDLDDIVLESAHLLQANGRIEVDMSRVSGAQVRGDESQLRRAVQNVADNAERHASSRVTLSLQEVSGAAVLSIADDGPGISAAQGDLIFERFGRLDSSRNRQSGGSGLGLAIAREIVRRHGGDIELVATERPGATFIMRLPLA